MAVLPGLERLAFSGRQSTRRCLEPQACGSSPGAKSAFVVGIRCQIFTAGLPGADEGAPPFRPQDARALRVAFVEKTGGRYPVGPEAAKALAQFAPGDQVTDGFQIADRHRPDRAC